MTALSGLLMFAADLAALALMPVFWFKMGLVGVLLLNGYQMVRTERILERGDAADPKGWRRLRAASLVSLALWFTVVLVGSILPNVS